MKRILEPEVMDNPQEASEYDAMDFLEVNSAFAQRAITLAPKVAKVLDAGTGTARIPILIAQQRPQWEIIGIDLAKSMLELGKKNLETAGLQQQISLALVDVKRMPYLNASFDVVLSNSLLHHLSDPMLFLKEIKRILKPGGAILLRDLLRPENEEVMNAMVAEVDAKYSEHQTQLFRNSLHAAFTLDEIHQLIQQAGLAGMNIYQSSDRHWTAERAAIYETWGVKPPFSRRGI